jgi:hypothetical protein
VTAAGAHPVPDRTPILKVIVDAGARPLEAMYRRRFLPLVAALLVALAGCATVTDLDGSDGGADDDDPDADDPGADDGDGDDAGGAGDGAGDGDDDFGPGDGDETPPSGTWEPFAFDRPGKYTFDVYSEEDGAGTLVYDVREIDDDTVTVAIDYETADSSYEQTITAAEDEVWGQLLFTPAGPLLFSTIYTPGLMFAGEELEVGDGWSYSDSSGSSSVRITGTTTVGGLACYTTEMKSDDTTVHESCLAPGHGVAPYSAYYDDDGTVTSRIELVSYEAN